MKQYLLVRLFLVCAIALACHSESIYAQLGSNSYREVALHYTISAGITFTSCWLIISNYPEMSLKNKYLTSAGIGILAGVGKEFIDLASSKYFDFVDIGVDLLGIGSGLVLHYIIFDKKTIRSSISFNISDRNYLASIKFYF
jgi:hypothetical protein